MAKTTDNKRPFKATDNVSPWIQSFDLGSGKPLDNRFVADKKADLYTDPVAMFGGSGGYVYIYDGLQVYVREDHSVYMYTGPYDISDAGVQNGVLEAEAKKSINWVRIADNLGIQGIKDYVDGQIDDNIGAIDFSDFYIGVEQALLENSNYTPQTADLYKFQHGEIYDDLQLTFTPLSPLALKMPVTVGDFNQGTTSESLNGKTISEILDGILFKTIYPTVAKHSVTIAGTVTGTQQPNSNMWTGYSYSFKPGTVTVNDGGVTPAQNYAGAASNPVYQMKYTPGSTNATNYPILASGTMPAAFTDKDPATVTRYEVGQYQYRVIVNYAQGPLMKTSKGASPNPMTTDTGAQEINPCPAGTATSAYGATINITLPVFIDKADGDGYKDQSLKAWGSMTFTGVGMSSTSAANPIKIKTPRTLKSVMSYNSVSGKYDGNQFNNFDMTQVTETIDGVDYRYFEYIYKGGAIDPINFEIVTN